MAGMIQILTYLLAFYLVVKGVEIFQIAWSSNREKRGPQMILGVVMIIICIAGAGLFVMMQDEQATGLSRDVSSSASSFSGWASPH